MRAWLARSGHHLQRRSRGRSYRYSPRLGPQPDTSSTQIQSHKFARRLTGRRVGQRTSQTIVSSRLPERVAIVLSASSCNGNACSPWLGILSVMEIFRQFGEYVPRLVLAGPPVMLNKFRGEPPLDPALRNAESRRKRDHRKSQPREMILNEAQEKQGCCQQPSDPA